MYHIVYVRQILHGTHIQIYVTHNIYNNNQIYNNNRIY